MNFHDFKVKDITGKEYDLSQLRGKRVLVVNTASECGFTPQFSQLEELYKAFGNDSFEIIGFPTNDFGAQDPGTNKEIAEFCQKNYGVTFPMMEKITVKGVNISPLFDWLQKESNFEIKWNFNKFLIDENGNIVKTYGSTTLPIDEEIIQWVEHSN
jgi:glutathione peroxidase